MSSDSKKHYHNKGQEDAKKGRYETPHGVMDDLTTWSESGMNKNIEDNTAYKKGYANTKGQEDGAKNKYKNPFKETSEEGKAYKESWRDSYDNEKNKSGGCFITTATIETMGLDDDCDQLNIMRKFRDNYLSLQPKGNELIAEYYQIAPQLLTAIDQSSNPKGVYGQLYYKLVVPVIEHIQAGEFEEATKRYQSIVEELKKKYLHGKDNA